MLFGKIIAIKMCRLESQTYNSSLKVIQWLTSPGSWFYWNRFLGQTWNLTFPTLVNQTPHKFTPSNRTQIISHNTSTNKIMQAIHETSIFSYQNFRALQLSHPFWNFIPEIYLTQSRLDRLLAFDSLVPTWHPLLMCLPRSPWPMESPSLLGALFIYPRSSKAMFHMSSSPSLVCHPIRSHEMGHGYTYGVEAHERHCED